MDIDRDPFAPTPPPGQDVLPSDDGEPMETNRHRVQMNVLIDTLGDAWAQRDDFYVAGNMFVYFSQLQTRGQHFRGPDVFVVLETEKKPRKCWVAWEEGGKLPNVVIELLSESTEHVDRGEKMRIYSRVWRTPEYFLYDPFTHVLEGYALVHGEYVPIAKDARGDLPSRQLGLALGVRAGDQREDVGPFLRWIDADGVPLPTAAEQRNSARTDADHARADADHARADADHARADADRARAEAAEARARAQAAEARLAELERAKRS